MTCPTRRGSMRSVTVAEQTHAADGAQGTPRLIRRVRRMNILSRMRDHDRRVGLRIYKYLRLGLAVASPLFVVAGVLGLLGFGGTRVNRQTVQGLSRVVADLAFIALGVLIGIVRLTVFRVQRPFE